MEECTIKALLELDIVTVDNRKVIQIPYEDILRGKYGIRINPTQSATDVGFKIVDSPSESIVIPKEIQKTYPDNAKDKMAQDVVDYLKIIAKAWEFKTLGFQPSLLKKAAKEKPALNGVIFQVYGKEGDVYLEALVKSNFGFIQKCWANA